jgi:hypothetical protein
MMTAVQHEIDIDVLDKAIALLEDIRQRTREIDGGEYQIYLDKHMVQQIEQLLDTYYGDLLPEAASPEATPATAPEREESAFYSALLEEFPAESDKFVMLTLSLNRNTEDQVVADLPWEHGETWHFWREEPSWRIQRPDGQVIAAPHGWLRRAFYTAVNLRDMLPG